MRLCQFAACSTMARLITCAILLLFLSAVSASGSKEKEEIEDLEISESRFVAQNILRAAFSPNFRFETYDPLQESSLGYVESYPTQQYTQPQVQPYMKQVTLPQLYQQQQPLNIPVTYFNIPQPIQAANLYGSSPTSSAYTTVPPYNAPLLAPPAYINGTLLSNIERLLLNLESELTELNKTKALIWGTKTVTLEVDIRLSPIVTIGGRSLSLGPRRGIHIFVISQTNGQIVDGVVFDLIEPGNSARLINYLDAVPNGSYVVIISSQEVFLALNQNVLNYIIALGSRSATSLAPGDRWIFVVQIRPPSNSLVLAETLSKAPECPALNLPPLFFVLKLPLE